MVARSKRISSRLCNRLVYVDEKGVRYYCPLQPGHALPHTVVGRIQMGGDAVLVRCHACNLTYYRSSHTLDLLRCVLCSNKLDLLGSISTKNDKGDDNDKDKP